MYTNFITLLLDLGPILKYLLLKDFFKLFSEQESRFELMLLILDGGVFEQSVDGLYENEKIWHWKIN